MNSFRKNLWGDIPKPDHLITPSNILKEQASILTEETKGLLVGEIKRELPGNNPFVVELRIKAPALNGYVHGVLEVKYGIELYPALVRGLAISESMTCSTQEEFEEALGKILSSDRVRQVIAALLAQVTEEAVPS
jgi:hypothetical protein